MLERLMCQILIIHILIVVTKWSYHVMYKKLLVLWDQKIHLVQSWIITFVWDQKLSYNLVPIEPTWWGRCLTHNRIVPKGCKRTKSNEKGTKFPQSQINMPIVVGECHRGYKITCCHKKWAKSSKTEWELLS